MEGNETRAQRLPPKQNGNTYSHMYYQKLNTVLRGVSNEKHTPGKHQGLVQSSHLGFGLEFSFRARLGSILGWFNIYLRMV